MSLSDRLFVAIGGQNPGVRAAGQTYVLKGTSNTFPILVCCTSPQQVADVQRLNRGIKEVTAARGVTKKIEAFVKSMEPLETLIGGTRTRWYAVWSIESSEGSVFCTIFAKYQDYGHLADAADTVHRRHRRFFNIMHAVIWLLAQGDSAFLLNDPQLCHYAPPADRRKFFDTPSTATRSIEPSAIEVSDDDDGDDLPIMGELPQSPALKTPKVISLVTPPAPGTPTPTVKRSRAPQTAGTQKPLAPGAIAAALKKARKTRRASGEALPTNPLVPVVSSSSSISSISVSSISTVSSISSASNIPLSTSHRSFKRRAIAQPFMLLRDIGGKVISTLMSKEEAPTPCQSDLLPPLVIDYLQSHGYTAMTFAVIEAAWTAASEEDAFINTLGTKGFAASEAGFIWRLGEYDEDF
ncbi:hypothetical protein EST38_g11507 [Candolleomyces aberdarensis]|uniref:Uncharacterized protein n=1 Tax=Candolleomyces aberdarensis TaxID=2316362 RepID=A0A4Q2D5D0_9AGAR|nr:hypothetical protein EST38_g11507 [Candolleomyces aberdarensis]